jgi:hypothetical protein
MREYGPGRPLVFNHIPKTAGTSLGAALQQVLQPAVSVQGIDVSLFGGYDDVESIRPTMRPYVFLTPEELPADATLVAGHIAPGTTSVRYPGADHITVLRAPQVRLLSQWLHSRGVTELSLRHWGPAGDAFRVGWRPLREYLQHRGIAPSIDNTMTRFFAYPHPLLRRQEFITEHDDDALFEAAVARLDSFQHVNVVENTSFLAELGDWLGAPLPQQQLNERTAVPPRMRPDLDAELDADTRALLDHRHRIDVRLWAHVAQQALPGAEVSALLARAVDGAVERYRVMLERPYVVSPVRRVAERVFELRARADRRRRSTVR